MQLISDYKGLEDKKTQQLKGIKKLEIDALKLNNEISALKKDRDRIIAEINKDEKDKQQLDAEYNNLYDKRKLLIREKNVLNMQIAKYRNILGIFKRKHRKGNIIHDIKQFIQKKVKKE